MKTCARCKISKEFSCFGKGKNYKDGMWPYCKQCTNERAQAYRESNPEKVKESGRLSRRKNPERIAESKRRYRENNQEKVKKARKLAYDKNRDVELSVAREYKLRNKDELAKKAAKRLKDNPHLNRFFRSQRRAAEKNAKPLWHDSKAVKALHIEAVRRKQETGEEWHVDHIVPLTSDLVCGLHWHGNMQLLPASVNQSKSNRHWPDMP